LECLMDSGCLLNEFSVGSGLLAVSLGLDAGSLADGLDFGAGGLALLGVLEGGGSLLQGLLSSQEGVSSAGLGSGIELEQGSDVLEGVVSEELSGSSSSSSDLSLDLRRVDDSVDVGIGQLGSGEGKSDLGGGVGSV